MTQRYTTEELMAAVISRQVKNGDTVAVGTFSPIPSTAALLAREAHAPDSDVYIMGSRDWWPFSEGSQEFFNMAQKGRFDFFFLSGAQIDQKGNINLHAIGDYNKPKVRLPGGAGSAMLYYMVKKVILFKTDHSTKSFVEKNDFITSSASSPPSVHRPGGLHFVITPMAVLVRNAETGNLELFSVHPGFTVDDVRQNTGFELPLYEDSSRETDPPTREELMLLRGPVKEEVAKIYPAFAQKAFIAN
ncbi:MAG: CoA-transferase [Bacillota bacterium]|nr:CoA-transferase [Bacillota bacterium]MDW7683598.1 CoA-transferase [Bacillota bacterium]